jgi:hypothetical protein
MVKSESTSCIRSTTLSLCDRAHDCRSKKRVRYVIRYADLAVQLALLHLHGREIDWHAVNAFASEFFQRKYDDWHSFGLHWKPRFRFSLVC